MSSMTRSVDFRSRSNFPRYFELPPRKVTPEVSRQVWIPVPLPFKQLCQEGKLQKRLSPCGGKTARGIEGTVPVHGGYDLLCVHEPALPGVPGIRIVAVQTAHGTALEKYHIADSRAVHGSEAFQRVDISFHVDTCLSFIYLMEGSGDHFILLFFGQLDKVYSITGYTMVS